MLCSLAMAALACSTVSYETKAYPRDWPVSLCTATCEGGERHTLLLGRARAAEGAYMAQRWCRPAPLLPAPPPPPATPLLEFETAYGAEDDGAAIFAQVEHGLIGVVVRDAEDREVGSRRAALVLGIHG